MKRFLYKGIDTQGNQINGDCLADNKKQAIQNLLLKGIVVNKIYDPSYYLKFIPKNNNDFEIIVNSLSNLLSAGLPLSDSLHFISTGTGKQRIQNAASSIYFEIKSGKTLSETLETYFENAPSFYTALIKTSEKIGKVETGLLTVSKMIVDEKNKKMEILTALSYPAILLFVMLGLVYFILNYALPNMLGSIDLSGQLPLPTKFLIFLKNTVNPIILSIFSLILLSCVLFIVRNRLELFSNSIDKVAFKIPLISNLIKIAGKRILLKSFSIGLSGGLDLLQVTNLVAQSMPNILLKNKLLKMSDDLQNGDRFSDLLSDSNILSETQIASIKIGDETDKLPQSFSILSDQYEKNLSNRLKVGAKIIEPLIIIIFGGIVLILALGIILPVLNATSNISF